MRESGFAVLPGAVASATGAPAIDFAMLLTAGRFGEPDGFAMTVLFDGFGSAAFFVADLAAADTVFFAVTDCTADLAEILRVPLFIADFAATRLPALVVFVALALTAGLGLRIFFATTAFMVRSLKHFRRSSWKGMVSRAG